MRSKSNGPRPAEDFAHQAEALRHDFETLVEDTGRLIAAAKGATSANAAEHLESMKARGEEIVERAGENLNGAVSAARNAIGQNPLGAVLIAGGIGFLLGLMSRRR
jgi:ElaB/YqjD/DUF883 family membrane-anchored ribosome-binding protein